MMKLRIADYGLAISLVPALLIFGAWGVNSLHSQGQDSAKLMESSNSSSQYLLEVKKDIGSGINWNLALGINEGKTIGDQLDVPKPGTLGPRTIKVIPLPGKTKAPDQVFRVDETTGKILNIYSNKQVDEKEAK